MASFNKNKLNYYKKKGFKEKNFLEGIKKLYSYFEKCN